MIRKAIAFLKKDYLVESSYRFPFVMRVFAILTWLLTYYFIDKLFGRRITPHLEEFGVNYFSYVLLSTAFFGYIGVGLGSFSERIKTEQSEGTLEAIFMTPTDIKTMLFSLVLWNFAFATIDMIIYILVGILFFNINFSNVNMISAPLILALTILSLSSLGILSASFVMVFKRGNPLGWLVNGLEGLVGGVYFPIKVLPVWLQFLANFFPITYSIRAIELSVYRGYSVGQLWREIGILAIFTAILFPLSLVVFKRSVKKAKMDGSLAQY